jgi:excisionase family DNA binding protein
MMAATEGKSSLLAKFADDYFTKATLSKALGTSKRNLERLHQLRQGPPRIKIGKLVLFRREAVDEWLAKNERK